MSSSNERGPTRGNGLTMAPLSQYSVVLANFPNWRSFANTLGLLTHPVICLCFVPFNKGHTYRIKITKVKLLLIHWNMKYLFKGKQRPFIKRLKASLVSYHISASITSQAALVSIWSLDQGLSEQSLKIYWYMIWRQIEHLDILISGQEAATLNEYVLQFLSIRPYYVIFKPNLSKLIGVRQSQSYNLFIWGESCILVQCIFQ